MAWHEQGKQVVIRRVRCLGSVRKPALWNLVCKNSLRTFGNLKGRALWTIEACLSGCLPHPAVIPTIPIDYAPDPSASGSFRLQKRFVPRSRARNSAGAQLLGDNRISTERTIRLYALSPEAVRGTGRAVSRPVNLRVRFVLQRGRLDSLRQLQKAVAPPMRGADMNVEGVGNFVQCKPVFQGFGLLQPLATLVETIQRHTTQCGKGATLRMAASCHPESDLSVSWRREAD